MASISLDVRDPGLGGSVTAAVLPVKSCARRLLSLTCSEWRMLALGGTGTLVATAAEVAYPQAIRIMLDSAAQMATGGCACASKNLSRSIPVLLVCFTVLVAATATAAYAFETAGLRAVARLRERLFEQILRQNTSWFDRQRVGELGSRIWMDVERLRTALSSQIGLAFRNLLTLGAAATLAFYTSGRLSLAAALLLGPVIAVGAVLGRRIQEKTARLQDAVADAGGIALEAFANIRTVRTLNAELSTQLRYRAALRKALSGAGTIAGQEAVFIGGIGFIGYASFVLLLWSGLRLVIGGLLSSGELVSFVFYILMMATAASSLGGLWTELMGAAGSADHVFRLLDDGPRSDVGADLHLLERPAGSVEFHNVWFSYPSRDEVPVLRGVSFRIDPGETVALVGPSGAGKSTIAYLLARLYEPSEGAIRLDGRDLSHLNPESIRRCLGFVSQEPVLFTGTIAENIRYGKPCATDEQIEAAAKAANAFDFISRLPSGFETQVGEKGAQLSGGQKQRIAVARAVLRDPSILILDEATSELDASSERIVQEAIDKLRRGRTTLVISHRACSLRNANRVLVIEKGRIVQDGSHRRLLTEIGPYRDLLDA